MLKLKNLDYREYNEFVYEFFTRSSSQIDEDSKAFINPEGRYFVPRISLLAVSEASSSDMFCVVISDKGNIVQMCKESTLKKGTTIVGSYCILKKYLKYIHFSSNTVISTLRQFIEKEIVLCETYLRFYDGDYELTIDEALSSDNFEVFFKGNRIETLEDLIIYFPNVQPLLIYYIPEEYYDFIHIYGFSKKVYSTKEDIYDLIIEKNYSEIVRLYNKEITQIITESKNMQDFNREIASIIINGIFPAIF